MQIVDLKPGAGGDCEALGTCDAEFVVGRLESKGFRWSPQPLPNGTLLEVPPLVALTVDGVADTSCRATAVNNGGVVVGVSDAWEGQDPDRDDVRRAFRWDPAVSPLAQDLGTLIRDPNNPGGFLGNSEARAINDNGWIVGVSDSPGGLRRACLWLPAPDPNTGQTILDLGALLPDGNSEANSVNDANVIVGVSDAQDSAGQAVRRGFDWNLFDRTPHAFSTLAVNGANVFGTSAANAINMQGVVVGGADYFGVGGALATQAFRSFPPGHVIQGLPMLIAPSIVATGINNDVPAKIVGHYGTGPTILTARSFVHDVGAGALTDLTSTLGITSWIVHLATGVNIAGQITGVATNPLVSGTTLRAVLLRP